MSEPLSLLNLDNSYPVEDEHHATNDAGTIRFIDATDRNGLTAMNRLQGDVQHKFRLMQNKINEMVNVWNSNPELSSFDNSPYVLIDGSHHMIGPLTLPGDPTQVNHAANRAYVDALTGQLQGLVDSNVLAIQGVEQQLPKVSVSDWVEHIWNPSVKQKLEFELTPDDPNLEFIVGMFLIEKLDIAQPSDANPDPDPEYVYRHTTLSGTKYGFFIDDAWLEPPNILHVLVPNETLFPQDYPASANYVPVTNPRQRWLKAVVMSNQSDPTLSSNITYKDGRETLVNGQDYIDITFPEAFAAVPRRIDAVVVRPSAANPVLNWSLNGDSLDEEGFRLGFSPAPGVDGYEVIWSAFL